MYYSLRKKILKRISRSVFVYSGLRIRMLRKMGVAVGKDVYIGENFILSDRSIDRDHIKIGDRVEMASNVTLVATSGPAFSKLKHVYRLKVENINIGNDVWIGTNAVILPGVTIGEFSIVGAGTIVDKDVPAFSYAIGNPMNVKAFPDTMIKILNGVR